MRRLYSIGYGLVRRRLSGRGLGAVIRCGFVQTVLIDPGFNQWDFVGSGFCHARIDCFPGVCFARLATRLQCTKLLIL
ncbi:MAG: hypothetical protein ACRERS_00500, partial [Methylococcales bacterium]